MNKTFDQNIYINNNAWTIFNIDKESCLNYFEFSNKNNVTSDELKLPKTEINNAEYINLSNKILYSMLNDNKIKFLNINDNIFYEVYNIIFNYRDAPIIFYYCNKNDPFIVVQSSSYMDFQYIIYINNKEIITITDSTSGFQFYLDDIINTLTYIDITNLIVKNDFKRYLFFGFNHNTGHHLWNEISGLYYFLNNKKYHDKIDGIIIGPYDSFNMEYYLKNNYDFNLIKFNDLFGNFFHNCNINLNNTFPIYLNSFFIDQNVKKMIDSVIYLNQENVDNYIDENNILEISINIRTNRRYLINQDVFYTKLINNLLNDYNNHLIKINLLGCFQTNTCIITNDHIEYIEQNKIANNIIQSFYENKNIIFNNFIGDSFFSIKKNIIKSKINILSSGTSVSNLINWIYNSKCICFGPRDAYQWTGIQYGCLKNFDVIMCPIEYITLSNGCQEPFDVDFNLYYEFFKNKLNELL